MKLPVLIVAQRGISGGVFDHGTTGQYIVETDLADIDWYKKKEIRGVINEWKHKILDQNGG